MQVFADYARYYNLLYRDKDYAGEVDFILEALRRHGCLPETLLDLGCGTGRHALEMARRGVEVVGVDLSATMLAMGSCMLEEISDAELSAVKPELYQGDARSHRLNRRFDAVTSLFHVMSYQTTEEDALALLGTAKEHLKPGGIFLFDFWHGPGVLSDLPAVREKKLEDDSIIVQRKAVPTVQYEDNAVSVHYALRFIDKHSTDEGELTEVHTMRYWFLPELRHLVRQAGFEPLCAGAWDGFESPGSSDWYAYMAVKLRS